MARYLVSQIESCYATEQDYTVCVSEADLGETGLAYGTDDGEVEASSTDPKGYAVVAHSKASDGGAHSFTITKDPDGSIERTCLQDGKGGCPTGMKW